MEQEMVRLEKVREARKKMFWLVDDPVAFCLACDKLAEVLFSHPDPEEPKPPPKGGAFFMLDKSPIFL